jgi:soluble lytic murein transglycosylase
MAGQSSGDSTSQASSSASGKVKKVKKPAKARKKAKKPSGRRARAARAAQTARIKRAFVASAELRPMAQQLATLRTPAAYAGVTKYAHQHNGEAEAAAYLALGHAYLLDKRYAEAEMNLRQARQAGEELADYADFLGAEANHEAGNEAAAEALLRGFPDRYPDSIFNAQAPELKANVLLAMGNAAAAQQVLAQPPTQMPRAVRASSLHRERWI